MSREAGRAAAVEQGAKRKRKSSSGLGPGACER